MTIEELLARESIRSVLADYCRAADHRDRDLMISTYWSDAWDDHGPMFSGRAVDFVDMAMASTRFEQTQHVLGQSSFAFFGDTAKVETYVSAHHRVRRDASEPHDVFVGARLFDVFECRDGLWKVGRRKLVMDWFRMCEDSADWKTGFFGGTWPRGSKSMSDLSYAFFAGDPV